mgnify:FL=1|jgi:hypothetical protein
MKRILILLLSGLVLTSCQNSSSGDKFIGKWKNKDVGTIEIKQNNQSEFDVIDITPGQYQGKPIDYCISGAKLEGDSLVCGTMGEFKLTIKDNQLVTRIGVFDKN